MENALHELADHLAGQSVQIALLFTAVAIACWFLRNASAHWRYLLWLVVLVKCITPPLATITLPVLPGQPSEENESIAVSSRDASSSSTVRAPVDTKEATAPGPTTAAVAQSAPVAPVPSRMALLAIGWLGGALVYFLIMITRGFRFWTRLKTTRRKPRQELIREVGSLAARMGLWRSPDLYLVATHSQPFVWGLARGAVYLPFDYEQRTTREQREKVLAHEVAHVRRCDAAVNLLQVIAQGLFFFHPLVWWANRIIRQEREKCCDEVAIAALSTTPDRYGRAIIDALAASRVSRSSTPALAVSGPARNVEERIRTIMTPNRRFLCRSPSTAVLTAALLAATAAPLTFTLTPGAAQDDAPLPQAAPQRSRGCIAHFSGGATAELVAISKLHDKERRWWAPDGEVLATGPYGGMAGPLEIYDHEVAIRFKGAGDASDRWSFPGSGAVTDTGRPRDRDGGVIDDLRVAAVGTRGQETMTVRYGAATGPWVTRATFDPRPGKPSSFAFADGGAIFNEPYSKGSATRLVVAHSLLDVAMRVVAVRRDGATITRASVSGSGLTGMASWTYDYPDLPLEEIDRFELQTRPYEWVEFRRVSLRPGRKTAVQIIGYVADATVEIAAGVERRSVNRKVADFPTGVDLATPEAAAATWNRAWADADTEAVLELMLHEISRSRVEQFWKRRDPIYEQALRDSSILEVLLYREELAAVISVLPFPEGKGRHPFSLRSFTLAEGKWKNLGEDRLPSVEAAREAFDRKKEAIWKMARERSDGS